jgi:hypothetical protein
MIIKRIKKSNLIVGIVGFVLVTLLFRNIEYSLAYLIGLAASNLNFWFNYHFLSGATSHRTLFLSNPGFNFIVRLLVYCVVLALILQNFSEYAVLFTFLGCLNIRISIIVQELYKGAGNNELYQ